MRGPVAISTYHEFIDEATAALNLGLGYHNKFQESSEDSPDPSGYYAAMTCRYSFLMIAYALEAAANALLLSNELPKVYYEELEKLNTLIKYKLFCSFHGKQLDLGNILSSRVKEIIYCRNEFVHPKPRLVKYTADQTTDSIIYDIKLTKEREYPTYFSEMRLKHSMTALHDTLAFIAWVCFDICKLDLRKGSMLLGINSCSWTGDIDMIEEKMEVTFDKRSLGMHH